MTIYNPQFHMLFFALKDTAVSVDNIVDWLQDAQVDGEIESEEEEYPGSWTNMTLYLVTGQPVVEIEKFSHDEGTLTEKIQETVRQLLDHENHVKPASAVKWLCQFMKRVKVIYEFRPMQAINSDAGWEIFNEVWMNLRHTETGIVHLDGEGFTNEEGCQITWEYPGEESGELKVAVLNEKGEEWIEYIIDLANQEQKELFMAGKAPDNTERPGN
jgi:hypothetical protein